MIEFTFAAYPHPVCVAPPPSDGDDNYISHNAQHFHWKDLEHIIHSGVVESVVSLQHTSLFVCLLLINDCVWRHCLSR